MLFSNNIWLTIKKSFPVSKRIWVSKRRTHTCSPFVNTHRLFYCAHKLVEPYPERGISWFAVGCYYLVVGRYDTARRYFMKSTQVQPRFAPAWLGFGHASVTCACHTHTDGVCWW